MLTINGTKLCPACGETKPVSEFHANNVAVDGYYSICKLCKKRRQQSANGRQYTQTCDMCDFLKDCRREIRRLDFWPYCAPLSKFHYLYTRKHGEQLEAT